MNQETIITQLKKHKDHLKNELIDSFIEENSHLPFITKQLQSLK